MIREHNSSKVERAGIVAKSIKGPVRLRLCQDDPVPWVGVSEQIT